MSVNDRLRVMTASRWITHPSNATTTHYPTNGQGGSSTSASLSEVKGASAGRPVVIESVEISCSADSIVYIKNFDGSSDLFAVRFKADAGKTQTFALGGAYGVQVNQGFSVGLSSTTIVGDSVKVYYRYV